MEPTEPYRTAQAPYRGLFLVGAAIAALLVATVAIVLVAGGRDAPDLQPGTPEAAVQEYLAAFENGDLEAAYAHFSAELRSEWSLEDYEDAVDAYGGMTWEGPSRRVLFDRTEVDGDVARVHLVVEEFYGDGLSGDSFRSPRVVRLARDAGAWAIDEMVVGLEPAPAPFR